jgi:hypothetical protein
MAKRERKANRVLADHQGLSDHQDLWVPLEKLLFSDQFKELQVHLDLQGKDWLRRRLEEYACQSCVNR